MAQGNPEWPPSPARLFQALVAGVARGREVPQALVPAFQWLESLPPPVIAAPERRLSQRVNLFVPNNDADSLADPRDVSGLRTKKTVQASSFAEDEPILYAWSLPDFIGHPDAIAAAARELYQLGRGVDMAWAVGEVLDEDTLVERLESYAGIIHRPNFGASGGRRLACPISGSLGSLIVRHQSAKLRIDGTGKSARVLFTNAPKPRFASVSYERKHTRLTFELHDQDRNGPWPWPLARVVKLIEMLRDSAAKRLRTSLPGYAEQIEATLVGRKADGRNEGPIEHRIRIVPLPSIGFAYADRAIRRFLLDAPCGAALSAADVEWAFSGLQGTDVMGPDTAPWTIARGDGDMLSHYEGPNRCWRTVTPAALPEGAKRRRIDPLRPRKEAKPATERALEEERAVAAVHVALRHVGVRATAVTVRVQREPFDAKGVRAEAFAEGTRFAKERLWHVELELDRPVRGPVVIGDGRFLGLGVMAPPPAAWPSPNEETKSLRRPVLVPPGERGTVMLATTGPLQPMAVDPIGMSRALRRAIMACVQEEVGRKSLERFFSGHEANGSKAVATETNHLAFQWDGSRRRFLVIAPHCLERRGPTWNEQRNLDTLERALERLRELRVGAAGSLAVTRVSLEHRDPLIVASRRWTSLTPYSVTRHQKRSTAKEVLIYDVLAECERRWLPRPEVTILETRSVRGIGLEGRVQLDFSVAVAGPIVLGRTRYLGGGMFTAEGLASIET